MDILGWIIVGLVAGALAKAATGTEREGCLFTMVIGIVGALIGGAIFRLAGEPGVGDGGLLWSILVAFVGATVLLLLVGGGRRNRRF